MKLPIWLRVVPTGCEVRIKVVPGASRSGIGEELGARLKVRIAVPPEGGRANRAIEEFLGDLTGCPCRVQAGHHAAGKTILVAGADPATLVQRLGL
ncbi:MAG: DUF167 domain-containing protein [Planctomycetota bacterium]